MSKPLDKNDKYYIYKVLNKYLLEGDPKVLEILCSDKKEATKLRYRVVTYMMSIPRILWYINKYLNNLYDFNTWTNEEWFTMFHQIMKIYGIDNQNQFYFGRYKTNEYSDFVKLIKDYYETVDSPIPSAGEIQNLHVLYKAGIIDDEDLENMKLLIDGKTPNARKGARKTTNTNTAINMNFTPVATSNMIDTRNKTGESLSPEIQKLITQVKDYIRQRPACKSCELLTSPPVILDTNLESPGPVDICFLGLNPGKDEVPKNLPFVGKAGQLLRTYIDPIISKYGLKYVITNCILCSTPTEKDIKSPAKTSSACKEIVDLIRQQFPAKLTVVLGDKAMQSVGIKGRITSNNGKLIDGYFVLYHPSSMNYGAKGKENFEKGIASLIDVLETGKTQLNSNQTNSNNSDDAPVINTNFRIPENKIIDNIDPSLTLFDIRTIGEQVIYIFKDKDGNKKYKIEQISVPIYIKNGSYPECPLISPTVDSVIYLSSQQKEALSKKLYHNMISIVKS